MEQNTSLPRFEIENEVDRYIAWPGQALAYKVGELKIRELRQHAEKKAGQPSTSACSTTGSPRSGRCRCRWPRRNELTFGTGVLGLS